MLGVLQSSSVKCPRSCGICERQIERRMVEIKAALLLIGQALKPLDPTLPIMQLNLLDHTYRNMFCLQVQAR